MTRAAIALLLAVHVLLVLWQFPPSAIADGGLPVKGDVARYLATMEGSERIGGVGLDPTAMAGYPVGTWNSIGKKGYEILGSLMPGVAIGIRMYAILVGVAVLSPLISTWFLHRIVPLSKLTSLALSLIIWHLDSQASYFWTFGNVLYPGTAALLPLLIALAVRIAENRRPFFHAVGLGLLAAWTFYAHTATVVAWVPPVLGIAITGFWKTKSLRPLVAYVLAALICIAFVAPWGLKLMQARGSCVPAPHVWFQAGAKHFLFDAFSDRGFQRPFDRNLFQHVAVIFGVYGTWLAFQEKRGTLMALGATGLWCGFAAYALSFVPGLRSVQPYRLLIPAILLLAFPAALALSRCVAIVREASIKIKTIIALLLLTVLPAFSAYLLDLLQPPMPCGLSSDERQLLDALKALPPRGRILCEPEQAAHLVPLWTGQPVLGGFNDQAFLKERFAGIREGGVVFDRKLSDWPPAELKKYLDAYAVGYAVFSTAATRDYADRHPELFEPIRTIGDQRIYFVNDAATGWLLEGSGEVTLETDGVRIQKPSENLVLKLHHSPLLTFRLTMISSNVKIEPTLIVNDPVPFVRLTDCPSSGLKLFFR